MKDRKARDQIVQLTNATQLLAEYVKEQNTVRARADASLDRVRGERYLRLEARVEELEQRLSGVEEVAAADEDVLSSRLRVEAHIEAERPILFRYTKLNEREWASRTVSPYEIQETRKGDLLLGWDHDREDIRSFRLDRIDAVAEAPRNVAYRPPED